MILWEQKTGRLVKALPKAKYTSFMAYVCYSLLVSMLLRNYSWNETFPDLIFNINGESSNIYLDIYIE